MKKSTYVRFFTLCLSAVLACCTLVSCGDDDKDEPNVPGSTGVMTYYGAASPTGVKAMSLFISAQHGETKLNIPGFPTIMARGHYNVYTRVIDSIILYSEDGGCEFAKWNPGSEVPAYFSDESSDYQIIVRTKCKNSDEYVYAYIEHVRSLAEATGEMKESLIGWNFKYTSPIDPITFKGF